jgi:hypothetical protein
MEDGQNPLQCGFGLGGVEILGSNITHLVICMKVFMLPFPLPFKKPGYLSPYSDGRDDRGSIPGKGKIFSFSPQRPDLLWGPPTLLPNG